MPIKWCFHKRKINPENKAVFITGCDSGFGHQLAKRLQSTGFLVFAGCLFPDGNGAKELQEICLGRLKILPLDVRSYKSVAEAFKFVKENLGSNVLWAVVNNAGTNRGTSFDFSSIECFEDTINVNALGPVRVAKAFLPMLKKSKGRIVNVASLAGRVPMIDVCPYAMSKRAVVALTECLSLEMAVWGVRVISIEPEAFQTSMTDYNIFTSRLKTELQETDQGVLSSYGEEYFEKKENMFKRLNKYSVSSNTSIVVDAMESAITRKHPDLVYKPRRNLCIKFFLNIYELAPFSLQKKMFALFRALVEYPEPKDAKT